MRYYLIAGEASGDMHAANLMEAIREKDREAEFRFWGGDRMQEQGGSLVKHYRDHAFMGFVEVLAHLKTILKNIRVCKADIAEYKPDLLILVDYPGFNLRIAEYAHKHQIKVAWYISPQIWAWKENRVHKIKRIVDEMFVILPFEKEVYAKHNYQASFVGHPLLDELRKRKYDFDEVDFKRTYQLDERPVIALLPGSRIQEIKRMLPVMLKVSEKFPEYQFVVAGTRHISPGLYNELMDGSPVRLIIEQTYSLLQLAHAGLITSGTASLETALFNVPQLVMYKTSEISYQIARQLVNLDYISIANLVLKRQVFKEFIQKDCRAKSIIKELNRVLYDKTYREQMFKEYEKLEEKLGGEGASQRAARGMIELASNT